MNKFRSHISPCKTMKCVFFSDAIFFLEIITLFLFVSHKLKDLGLARFSLFVSHLQQTFMCNLCKPLFLAHQIRISKCFTCTYKSYLIHVISPTTDKNRVHSTHWLYRSSRIYIVKKRWFLHTMTLLLPITLPYA